MQGKEKKSKKRNKTLVLKIVFLALTFNLVFISGFFLYCFNSNVNGLEGIDINDIDSNLNYTSTIYCLDSETNKPMELIRLYNEENRIWIDLEDIPEVLANAFIAIEDERFWKHPGVDFKRTLHAAFQHLVSGESSFGGSTITQQLIKNLTKQDTVSINRKVKEIFQALQLERKMSKEKILELYLNVVYLGEGCSGVQAASNTYFGKSAKDLTLAEAASIAAITQFPNKYDPFLNPEENKKRQLVILKKMLDLKYIDQEGYNTAKSEPLKFVQGKEEPARKFASFIDAVISSVLADLQKEKGCSEIIAAKFLYTGGLQIYATVDPKVQNSLEKFFYNPANFPAATQEEKPESAAVVLDPFTGQVKGIIGGREKTTAMRILNRATQSVRQPGSSIKPLSVYAPAIELGVATPDTIFADEPLTIDNWSPKNWYGGYWGRITVKTAVEESSNMIAVKVLQLVGLDHSYDFLKTNLGITTLVEKEKRSGIVYTDKLYPALALGGMVDGVTVLEMAAAYGPFVNKGIYIKPYVYSKIEDHNGKVLLNKEDSLNPFPAMREQTAVGMTRLLSGVVNQGTATYARLAHNMPAAGKTGTTSDDKDRWFIGFTPYYVGAVWFGFDYPRSTSEMLAGRPNPAVVLWRKTMDAIHQNLPAKEFYPAGSQNTGNKKILHLKNNSIYEGEVKNGAANGTGMLTLADGSRYIGQFKNNKRNGKGVLLYPDGGRYEGDFENDARTGTGTMIWSSGDRYEGEFANGKINGNGTFTWASGDCYTGRFKDGSFNGNGSMKWVSGDSYSGEWKDGEFNGYGTFTRKGGKPDSGLWIKGKRL